MFGFGNIIKCKRTIEIQEEMIENLYDENNTLIEKCVKLEKELLQKRDKRKNRKQIARAIGYKRVTKDESLEIYEMYKKGEDLYKMANHLHRSQSCISRHIRKHLEEEDE